MKLLWIVADAARLDALRHDLKELGAPGYSVVPIYEGAGQTGVHMGDRIQPGARVSVLVVTTEDAAGPLFNELVRRRDAAQDRITRFFMLPVERQA